MLEIQINMLVIRFLTITFFKSSIMGSFLNAKKSNISSSLISSSKTYNKYLLSPFKYLFCFCTTFPPPHYIFSFLRPSIRIGVCQPWQVADLNANYVSGHKYNQNNQNIISKFEISSFYQPKYHIIQLFGQNI